MLDAEIGTTNEERIQEWEAIGADLLCGNQTACKAIFFLMKLHDGICTEDCVLWMTGLLQITAALLLTRSFHINHPLCTALLTMPVGDVGNHGGV